MVCSIVLYEVTLYKHRMDKFARENIESTYFDKMVYWLAFGFIQFVFFMIIVMFCCSLYQIKKYAK